MTDQTKSKPTPTRSRTRERAAQLAEAMQEWRRDRIVAAEERRKARRKAREQEEQPSRGVDRVPERLQGGHFTIETHLYGKRDVDQERPLVAQPRQPWAGKRPYRKPRRRDLPGAEARRLERNRKAWLQ